MSVVLAADMLRVRAYCPACDTSFDTGTLCPNDSTPLVRLEPAVDPMIGRDIDNRFRVVERLGQGGMGAVYRAHQHSVGREVAIKVIHPNLISDPEIIRRFLREARLASKLNHPNAVSILDSGQTSDGLFYLVMELVTGNTLDALLGRAGSLEASRLIRIGVQVCDALQAAHELAIVHRDLKPANIMLLAGSRDFVKVLDFGLAKSLLPDDIAEISTSGSLHGTPAYLAPERARGGVGDCTSDLYSLGCILYLLGSGMLPFNASNLHDLLMKQVTEPAPPMVGVPFALARVIDRLLEKDPRKRYQSASETRDALEAAGQDVSAPHLRPVTIGPHDTQESRPISRAATQLPVGAHERAPVSARRIAALAIAAIVVAIAGTAIALRGADALENPRVMRPPPQAEKPASDPAPALPPGRALEVEPLPAPPDASSEPKRVAPARGLRKPPRAQIKAPKVPF
ncbi:MAG: protein kinase [Kofleriaceae bacterium]